MEMTKQRKMLLGVLIVGVLGLVVDRFLLAAPESAAADDSDVIIEVPAEPAAPALPSLSGSQTAQAPTTESDDEAATLSSYASLPERLIAAQQLAAHAESEGRDDPFALPPQWRADQTKPLTQSQDPNQEAKATGQRLTVVFTLDGTVRSQIDGKEEMMAVISGGGLDSRAVRLGQKVRVADEGGEMQEYTLVEVGTRYVVWLNQAANERIEMHVEEDL